MVKNNKSLGQMIKNGEISEAIEDFNSYSKESLDILAEHQHDLPSELDTLLFNIHNYIYDKNKNHHDKIFDLLDIIIKNGGNPNACFKGLQTPFMKACEVNDVKLIKYYIENHYNKAKIEQADAGGNDAIVYAVLKESTDIIELLINEYGVDIDKEYYLNSKKTLLHIACEEGLEKSVNKLIELNANPNLRDDYDNLAVETIPFFDDEIHSEGDIKEETLKKWDDLFEKTKIYTENYGTSKSKKHII